MKQLTLLTSSPEETELIGQRLGKQLRRGMFLALSGNLGGGKTCFTRGIVASIAPESAELVSSPTFAIMNEYPGQIPVYHFDFYRLSGSSEIIELGFEEYFDGDGVCIAEWAERIDDLLPTGQISILFEYLDDNRRRLTFQASGEAAEQALTALSTP